MSDDERARMEFIVWARKASVPVLLEHAAKLMRGHRDPYHLQAGIIRRFDAAVTGGGWASVLRVIAAVQEEREL